MEKNNIWVITPKTNLHVGDENTSSYGLIDKAIQRNAVTELPCINSSSLKGAIKEFASECVKMKPADCKKIFGSAKGDDNDTAKGEYTFFDAEIVAIPIPDDKHDYCLAVCEEVIQSFVNKAKLFGTEITIGDIKKMINGNQKIVDTKEFKRLCDDNNLPIIARNKLNNGTSVNLWYEQVLPPESVLLTIINTNNDDTLTNVIDNNNIIQVGANATIGYGYCKFEHL